jgi:hypothetical protein
MVAVSSHGINGESENEGKRRGKGAAVSSWRRADGCGAARARSV